MEDVVRLRQVEAEATGFQADQEQITVAVGRPFGGQLNKDTGRLMGDP